MEAIFYPTGDAWCFAPEAITEEHIVATVPADTALWRLSIDVVTKVVSVRYPTLSDADADLAQAEEIQADADAAVAAG